MVRKKPKIKPVIPSLKDFINTTYLNGKMQKYWIDAIDKNRVKIK